MERKIYLEKKYAFLLAIIYAVGIAGHLYDKTLQFMLLLTPFTLLVGALLIIYNEIKENRAKRVWFIISFVLTFLVEMVGVKTKYIFGDYTYGNVLGTKLFEVPLIIGINWVLIVLGSISIASRIFNNKVWIVLASGLISMLFDFILEPVAIKLGYWSWMNNSIPLQNYIAWFLIASIISSLFVVLKLNVEKSLAEKYLHIQIVFFLILNCFL